MTWPERSFSLYLHIPFCKSRCTYCAFNTYTGLDELIPSYVVSLVREMRLAAERDGGARLGAHTLYFGGGTPSLLKADQVALLIEAGRGVFALADNAEITLEVNPGTVDELRLREFLRAGVNRVSIGVQSRHEAELAMFGRDHTFSKAAAGFRAARRAGFENINVDLIYGAPHQTRSGWRQTLNEVLAWEPAHISLYSLSLEPGTRLAWKVEHQEIPAPDPDLAADMYEDARERMQAVGLRQYEISNWALPGYECAHNRQYWINGPFYGFGAGAHGFVRGIRYWNAKSVREYMARVEQSAVVDHGLPPAADGWDVIDRPTAMAEMLILNLRLVDQGIDLREFEARFGHPADAMFGEEIARLEALGLLRRAGEYLRLDQRAYLLSNQVFARFMPDA